MPAKNKQSSPDRIRQVRLATGMNQHDYWTRFGLTQSGGSRYETTLSIPKPTAMLLWLHQHGRITDQDLADALKAVSRR